MSRSTVTRVISGSFASWLRLGMTIGFQMGTVPILLKYWSPSTFGVWVAFLSATGFLQIVDTGHQTYLGSEFLKAGSGDKARIEVLLSASLPVAATIGILQLISVALISLLNVSALLGPASADLTDNLKALLVTQSIVWLIFGSIGGILVRALIPFGYSDRFSWWGTFLQAVMGVAPLISVLAGGGLLMAGLSMLGGVVFVNILMFIDIRKLFKRQGIVVHRPKWNVGISSFWKSLGLTGKAILEMLRQQGARLIIAPLAGVSQMAAFATMRTGSNVALQGLGTITNPIMPELMRFLNQRDQARTDAAFGTIWFLIVGLMTTSVIVLQVIAPKLFLIWTRGKVQFDPSLFAMLSISVLIFAIAQPAMVVAQGNNLIKEQFVIAAIAGLIAVLGMLISVPAFGLIGVGGALLFAETISLMAYLFVSSSWLKAHGMAWPWPLFIVVACAVICSAVALVAIALFPNLSILIASVAVLSILFIMRKCWVLLPALAKDKVAIYARFRVPTK